jgi:hypothetical protein
VKGGKPMAFKYQTVSDVKAIVGVFLLKQRLLMSMIYEESQITAELEVFVHPSYRRRHFASLLRSFAIIETSISDFRIRYVYK